MIFKPTKTDYKLSPYTGLTRESWLEASEYLLRGVFKNIKSISDPVLVPRKETYITYPHLHDSEELQATQRKAEIFEGLARTFFIASALIHNDPDTVVCGHNLCEYYKAQVLRICSPGDPLSVGSYDEQLKTVGSKDRFRVFQQTVETCALVVCLHNCRNEIWDAYTKEEKDVIADFISSYAHAGTVPQNWRLFNMLAMAFLYNEGYPIDEDIMREHAQAILNYYAGDG